MEPGIDKWVAQTLMVAQDEDQSDQMSLKSTIISQNLAARCLSQSHCGNKQPEMALIVHEVQIRGKKGLMQQAQALIECSMTSNVMTPRLLKQLKISHKAALITNLGMNGGVIQHAEDSRRKTQIRGHYLDYLAPVDRTVMQVVPMSAYDLVHNLPYFNKQSPDIYWARLTPCDPWVHVERRKWPWWLWQ